MKDILRASWRAFGSMLRPRVLWHFVWPMLVSMLVGVVLGILFIGRIADAVEQWLQTVPHIGQWMVAGGNFSHFAASGALQLLLWALMLTLILAGALMIISTVAMPMMLDVVAARDYADLERRAGGSNLGSLRNSLIALAIFLVLLVLSLPLWLIPGVGPVILVLLSTWLNRRCLAYDALMNHADYLEIRRLPRKHRWPLNLIALVTGALSYVPLLNFVVPAWGGLAFVHYLLDALRMERAGEVLRAE